VRVKDSRTWGRIISFTSSGSPIVERTPFSYTCRRIRILRDCVVGTE
jgi:hypothetical protein